MADVEEIKHYFKKLQKVINFEIEFNLFGIKLIKKNKIDDVLVCIQAALPDSYKKIMKTSRGKKLTSVIGYEILFSSIKRKFVLNSDVYMVDDKKATRIISSILVSIEKDIEYAEKNAT